MIFTIIALLQLTRALAGWEITVGTTSSAGVAQFDRGCLSPSRWRGSDLLRVSEERSCCTWGRRIFGVLDPQSATDL